MAIETGEIDGVTLLTCVGPLTMPDGKTALVAAIEEPLQRGVANFVLDLRQVPYMDSPTIGAMMSGFKRAIDLSGGVKLALGERGKVREILELTGLSEIVEIFDDPDAAVRSFGAAGA